MTQDEFMKQWEQDKSVYDSWGDYIVRSVVKKVASNEHEPYEFFKIQPSHRLKDDNSLIDKAFYRKKKYQNPYVEIEDKVGCRFVVLLLDQLSELNDIIKSFSEQWDIQTSRDFNLERNQEPLLFTYQSIHMIVRPKYNIEHNGKIITPDFPCEIQIRTLLQHAHAELTHDSIYKTKKIVESNVHRTVAKCMALIETTDQFFLDVSKELNKGPLTETGFVPKLNDLYFDYTGKKSLLQKSSMYVFLEFEHVVDNETIGSIKSYFDKRPELVNHINEMIGVDMNYSQSTILFIFWLMGRHRRTLLEHWPLDISILEPMADVLGVSLQS